jgi:hypothetical protein
MRKSQFCCGSPVAKVGGPNAATAYKGGEAELSHHHRHHELGSVLAAQWQRLVVTY